MLAQNAKSLGKLKNVTISWYTWVLKKNNSSNSYKIVHPEAKSNNTIELKKPQ